MRRVLTQRRTAPISHVTVYGGCSSYAYGSAAGMSTTSTGHSFSTHPIGRWQMGKGAVPWFATALPDGKVAFGQMTATLAQNQQTAKRTTLWVFDPAGDMYGVDIPTSTGYLEPPHNNGITSGAAVDDVDVVGSYLYATISAPYSNWLIGVYGVLPTIAAFKSVGGVWTLDPTRTWTADQLAASSSAGASAFPAAINIYGEGYRKNLNTVEIAALPQSGHLAVTCYFGDVGHNSGGVMVIDPTIGKVTAWYQFPDCTDSQGRRVYVAPRAVTADPTSAANDERFVVTPDVSAIDANADRPFPVMEFAYNAGAGTITLKSQPVVPDSTGLGFLLNYNLTEFDSNGNLYCPSHGGVGVLGPLLAGPFHVYKKVAGSRSTLLGSGPIPGWETAGFRTSTSDQAVTVGGTYEQSLNWDSAHNRVVIVAINGQVRSVDATTYATTPVCDMSKPALQGTTQTQHKKGAIVGGRLYMTLLTKETDDIRPCGPAPAKFVPCTPYDLTAWMVSLDLAAL